MLSGDGRHSPYINHEDTSEIAADRRDSPYGPAVTATTQFTEDFVMRRADRLFQIIQHLRRRKRPVTAQMLAERLEVSERTIYRDISDLSASGVPVRGEAGVGYLLSKSYDLPPLMFDETEIEALVLGARVVKGWGDPELAEAADTLLSKVENVVPPRLRPRIERATLFALNFRASDEGKKRLGRLRRAIREQRRVHFEYTDRADQPSERTVQPIGLFYWGLTWTLGSWCELREDFRSFRVDRMKHLKLEETFETVPGRSLDDMMRRFGDD